MEVGWARDGTRQKLGEGRPCWGGGGGREQVSPLLADLALVCATLAPLPDLSLYPNPPPVRPPPAPAGRPNLLVLVPRLHRRMHVTRAGRAGTGLAICCDTKASVICTRAGSAAGPRWGRRCARLPAKTGPAVCVGEVREGQAVACAGCPCTLGAPPAIGGEVMAHSGAPALRAEARHAGHQREEGGVQGARSWPTGATLSCKSRRLGHPGAARSAGDPSPGRGAVRPRAKPTGSPPDAGSGLRGGGATS